MASEKTAIDNQLMLLKTRFANSTATQLDAMLGHFSDRKISDITYEELVALYQLLHRLGGSSATFGFNQLGQQAARLEQAIKPLIDNKIDSAIHTEQIINADFLNSLQQLTQLLQQDNKVLATDITPPLALEENKTHLLVIGQELQPLAATLTSYGFTIYHCEQPIAQCEQCWNKAGIIITPDHQVTVTAAWNSSQAQKYHQATADIICVGVEDTFAARYALASQGAKGLFTLPVDIPKLAERIEQISQERQPTHASKVLLLDDDQVLAEHYRLVLTAAGKEVQVMHSPEGILAALADFRPDIVLLDVHMLPYSGVTLARMIRLEPEWLSLPIIYLSSE